MLAARIARMARPEPIGYSGCELATSQVVVPNPSPDAGMAQVATSQVPAPITQVATSQVERFRGSEALWVRTRLSRVKLRYAQALLSHAIPSGDVDLVLDRALDALI